MAPRAQAAEGDATARTLEAAHRRLLENSDLQFAFPPPEPRKPPPDWLTAFIRALGEALDAAGPLVRVAFWLFVAVVVCAILYLIWRETAGFRFRRRQGAAADEGAYQPERTMAEALLADADRLAAEGRYAEAVHIILLRSIDDIRKRRPRSLAPALTARDIAALEALPPPARPAFSAMAGQVERSLFGGAPVDAAGFAQARSAYEEFALPKVWS